MDSLLTKLQRNIISLAPVDWENIYLYFEYIEGLTSTVIYFRVNNTIISYSELQHLLPSNADNMRLIMGEVLTDIYELHSISSNTWNWGTIYISSRDKKAEISFYNTSWDYDNYLAQNKSVWEYKCFGKLYPKDQYDPKVYQEMLKGEDGILL